MIVLYEQTLYSTMTLINHLHYSQFKSLKIKQVEIELKQPQFHRMKL